MRYNYVDRPTRSIISLSPVTDGWEINRVSVLPPHRGLGIASRLLDEVLADADREHVILWLIPVPGSGTGLTPEQLILWYRRKGFVHLSDGWMFRRPRT